MTKRWLYFLVLFVPVVWLLTIMNNVLLPETMRPLNTLVCSLLLYFAYVICTVKTEVVVITKKQIVKKGKRIFVKQICTKDGRCFEEWGGFSVSQSLFNQTSFIKMGPRLTDEEFQKIKVGQSYRVQYYHLLLSGSNYLWSVTKVGKNIKKLGKKLK